MSWAEQIAWLNAHKAVDAQKRRDAALTTRAAVWAENDSLQSQLATDDD